jgi:predicted nucleotidyltransferase
MDTERPDIASTLARALGGQPPVPILAAYLFGSHVSGRSHRESDVDVGVLLPWGSTRRDRFESGLRLCGFLQAELRCERVDLVVLNDAPPPLARHIVTAGRLIACTDRGGEHAFRRDTLLRAADLEPFLRRMRRIKLEALGR